MWCGCTCRCSCSRSVVGCSVVVVVAETATKPSPFAHFWQGAQSLAPATHNDIWTSKSAPYTAVFCTFDLEMCFAPQRRALFRHLNFQKWSETLSFLHFWLRIASRHKCVQFFVSHLPRWLRTRRFSEPTFRSSGATNHWKNTVFRLCYLLPFHAPASSFFSLFLSLIFSLLLFSSLTLPTSAFPSVHIVGSLTSIGGLSRLHSLHS